MRQKICFILLVVAVPLIIALYLAEFVAKKAENNRRAQVIDYGYVKQTAKLGRGGFLKHNIDTHVSDGLGGNVRWTNNADGFRNDHEFGSYPPPGTLRILSLGDSFTAGYRVAQDQTYSYLLEQWVNRKVGPAEVMVAEIEEPAKALYYLTKFGQDYHPHMVLLGITLGNDLAQNYVSLDPHGGYILNADHNRVTIEPQAIEYRAIKALDDPIPPAYLQRETYLQRKWHNFHRWFTRLWLMRSYYKENEGILSSVGAETPPKLFDCGNALGIFMQPAPPPIEEAYRRLFRVLAAMQTWCQQHQVGLVVAIFPQRFQVQSPDWESAVDKYRLNKAMFDLMGPNKRIRQFCLDQKIILIDPTAAMAKHYAETGKTMYLPFGDMHWNKAGQAAFFEGALPVLGGLARTRFHEMRASHPHSSPDDVPGPGAGDGKTNGISARTPNN
jgi:hypothetical protein